MLQNLNYFQVLCFAWAALGIGSRILMVGLGARWNAWETRHAYTREKPRWVYAVGLFLVVLLGYTWYQVVTMQVPYGWVIAVLVSLTSLKVYMILFQYERFRAFVVEILNDQSRMLWLNLGVLLFSATLIGMGVFLYG